MNSDEGAAGGEELAGAVAAEVALLPTASAQRMWAAHAAVLMATMACFAPLYSLQALYPVITARYHEDVGFAAMLLTVCTVGLALFSPLAGQLSARVGLRRSVQLAIAGLIVSNVAIAFVETAAWLLAWRVVQGFLIPIGLAALIASLGEAWSANPAVRASLAVSYTTGVVLGGLCGRFVPAGLMSIGWSEAFLGFALFQGLLGAGAVALFPKMEVGHSQGRAPIQAWLVDVLRVVRVEIPACAIGGFALMASQAAITNLISVRLAEEPFHWGTVALGSLYLVFVPSIAAVRITPFLIQRIKPGKTLLVACCVMWLGLSVTLFDVEWLILVGMVIFSAGIFVAQTVLAQVVSSSKSEHREQASAGYLSAYYAGASVGAVAPVAAWSAWGWPGCLVVVALTQLLGLILALLVTRRSRGMSHRRDT